MSTFAGIPCLVCGRSHPPSLHDTFSLANDRQPHIYQADERSLEFAAVKLAETLESIRNDFRPSPKNIKLTVGALALAAELGIAKE